MNRRFVSIAVGFGLMLIAGRVEAQAIYGGYTPQYRGEGVVGGKTFGTSWGTASYGSIQTFSRFASPYGAGYGYGYPPTSFLPGRFGIGLWRPGSQGAELGYGVPNAYRTFPYPYPAGPARYGPPIGVYAPAFGPELPPG